VNSRESRSHYGHVENEYKQSATGRPPRGEYASPSIQQTTREISLLAYTSKRIRSCRIDTIRREGETARGRTRDRRSAQRCTWSPGLRKKEEKEEEGKGREGGREGGRRERGCYVGELIIR